MYVFDWGGLFWRETVFVCCFFFCFVFFFFVLGGRLVRLCSTQICRRAGKVSNRDYIAPTSHFIYETGVPTQFTCELEVPVPWFCQPQRYGGAGKKTTELNQVKKTSLTTRRITNSFFFLFFFRIVQSKVLVFKEHWSVKIMHLFRTTR